MATIHVLDRTYLARGNRVAQRLSNGLVLKIGCPNSYKSGYQNRLEGMAWDSVKHIPGIENAVVPVIDYAHDGSWLLMPEVQRAEEDYRNWSRDDRNEYYRQLDALKRVLIKIGLGDAAADAHMANLGYNSKGALVILDYGFRTKGRMMFDQKDKRICTATCEWARLTHNVGDRMHPVEE